MINWGGFNEWKGPRRTRMSLPGASYLKNDAFLLSDCPYGTYGVECRKTCSCKGGICDRETGACLSLPFFAKIASKLKNEPQAGKKSANRHRLKSSSAGDLSLRVFVFRHRGGIRRGAEHRAAHGPFHCSKEARPSLTGNQGTWI